MFKVTLKVDGMACGMCEKRVNSAIEAEFDVKKVASSHKKAQTVVTSKEELDVERLKNVIEDCGYTVGDITVEK